MEKGAKSMKQDESTRAWNRMGEEWIQLVQDSEHRTRFIMPHMLHKLQDVAGKNILDLGCGEGGYARELARRGALVTAVDCNEAALIYSAQRAVEEKLSICHFARNSNDLDGFVDNSSDIVLCSMMLMDCEDLAGTLREAARVLKPDGSLFASVLHPCFDGEHETGIGRQGTGLDRQVVVKNYFEPAVWDAPLYKGVTPVRWHHRTLEEYMRAFLQAGLTLVDLEEPRPSEKQAALYPAIAWLRKVPLYLFMEWKKK